MDGHRGQPGAGAGRGWQVSRGARALRGATAVVLLAFTMSGCGTTTSTEVGVRTRLVWFFEKRGTQEIYAPGGVYFFLPLIMLRSEKLFPVTFGLYSWNSQLNQFPELRTVVLVGAFVSIIPLVVTFLRLQRFWRTGLGTGSLK